MNGRTLPDHEPSAAPPGAIRWWFLDDAGAEIRGPAASALLWELFRGGADSKRYQVISAPMTVTSREGEAVSRGTKR